MKAILRSGFLAVAIMAQAVPATYASEPTFYLECKGYRFDIDTPVSHGIAISGDTAQVDRGFFPIRCDALECNIDYELFGRPHTFKIDRLTGGYWIMEPKGDGSFSVVESARHEGGCKIMERKF